MSEKLEDKQTGIAIRFVREFTITPDPAPVREDWYAPGFAGAIIDQACPNCGMLLWQPVDHEPRCVNPWCLNEE